MMKRIVATLICAGTLTLAFDVEAETVLSAVYDGELKDQSEFHNVPSVLPAKHQLQYIDASKGKGLVFNGEILVYRNKKMFQPERDDWTMEAKLKIDAPLKKRVTIMGGTPGNGRAYGIRLDKSGKFFAYFDAAETLKAHSTSQNVSKIIFDNGWHVVAAVRDMDRNGEIRIYLDGVDITKKTGYQPWSVKAGKHYMGFVVGAVAPWFYKNNSFLGAIEYVNAFKSIPARYKAKPGAVTPPPVPEITKAAAARISPSAPESKNPVTLKPENTFITTSSHISYPEDGKTARMIQKFLRKIHNTSKGFNITSANKLSTTLKRNQVVIAIGNTRWLLEKDLEKVKSHGFIIKRKGNIIVICGKTPESTLWGGVEFLNKYCDVRFYMPTELFTHVPKNKKITIKGIDIVSNPYIKRSSSTGYYNLKAERSWLELNALERRDGTHQHSFFRLLPVAKFADKYPHIYPIINRKRVFPKNQHSRWQPCFSEPTLVDASEEAAKQYFKEKPEATYIAFSVMDNHYFCQCDRCLKLLDEHGKAKTKTKKRNTATPTNDPTGYSWIYWKYMNEIAKRLEKEFPNKRIVGISYAQVRCPPPFKLHKNIVVYQVWKHSDNFIDKRFVLDVPKENAPPNTIKMREWGNAASHAGHHDWAHGDGFLIPRFYPTIVKKSFDNMEKIGFPIEYTHMEAYPSWGVYGPFYYIVGRIWWDPASVDVAKMLKRFCDDMFGKSADDMFNFFRTEEDLWNALNNTIERKLNRYRNQFITNEKQRKLIKKCRSYLDSATANAREENVRKRVKLFSKTFKLSEMIIAAVAKGTPDQAASDAIIAYADKVIIPDPMTIFRKSFKNKNKGELREIIMRALKAAKVTPKNTK